MALVTAARGLRVAISTSLSGSAPVTHPTVLHRFSSGGQTLSLLSLPHLPCGALV